MRQENKNGGSYDTLDVNQRMQAWRFDFVDRPDTTPPGRWHFSEPRPAVATRVAVDLSHGANDQAANAAGVLVILMELDADDAQLIAKGIALPTAPASHFKSRVCHVRHWPGCVVIQAAPQRWDELLDGVVAFCFYQSELRDLEQALKAAGAQAVGDVQLAFQTRLEHRPQWPRLHDILKQLAIIRLQYAALRPNLIAPSSQLPALSHRVVARLLERSQTALRVETFEDRLETCEDLYEGAIDRITDFGWWRKGNLLEIWIVVLLVLEVVLLIGELIHAK